MVNNTSALLAILEICAFVGRNAPLVQSLVVRFFVCLTMLESIANLESLVGDFHLENEYELFGRGAFNAGIDHFINDDHCNCITRYKTSEIRDFILRLGLDEQVIVHRHGACFCRFHREELLICVLNKLAFGVPHFYLGDSVFGGHT